MIVRILIVILLAIPLVSFAPAPAPIYHARIAVQTSARSAPPALVQPCTFETATARLQQQIEDPIGYPYGFVTAFSCTGDTAGVIADLAQRVATMQAEAAAYRQAHPITGAPR